MRHNKTDSERYISGMTEDEMKAFIGDFFSRYEDQILQDMHVCNVMSLHSESHAKKEIYAQRATHDYNEFEQVKQIQDYLRCKGVI